MKIEKLSKEATIRELAMRLDELIDAHNESQEPKALEDGCNLPHEYWDDFEACITEGEHFCEGLRKKVTHLFPPKSGEGCRFCPTKNGVHIHPCIKEVECQKCNLPYYAHEQILNHTFEAKPQDEPKVVTKKDIDAQLGELLDEPKGENYLNDYELGIRDERARILRLIKYHQESETEVKECPYGCSHHKVLGYCGKCPNPCSGDYIILPRPKGMRIGQSIENFLRFAKKVGLLEDAFYYRDEEVLEMWSDFLKSLEK